jgi:DNA-binding NtrC family response regulator
MEKILIVEDELIVARDIRVTLERAGYKVSGVARTAEKALSFIEGSRPTLVVVDIFLKGALTGIDLATRLDKEGIPFIYVSANSNQPVLEAAKTTNPYGFVVKPFREKDLLVAVDIARYRYDNNKQMNPGPAPAPMPSTAPAGVSRTASAAPAPEGLIGKSAAMLQVFQRIQQVAPYETSVLLLGESGTGKEGAASAIFRASTRSTRPFIKLNCAAIPSDLIEAELFGYEKGAFTGALDRKAGKFELAAGGTLLLDEVGEIPIDMQAKLLRVLQEKEIQRIGSSVSIRTDVRIIAATSRNLEKEVGEGKFRLDLYYRLLVFPISLPPLRDRKEDIPLLVHHFLKYYSARTGKKVFTVRANIMQKLIDYNWPGNVRELQHLIERSMLLAAGDTIDEIELPEDHAPVTATGTIPAAPPRTLEEMERAHILDVLRQCNFKITGKGGAAGILNLSPGTLHGKLKKLGITKTYKAS